VAIDVEARRHNLTHNTLNVTNKNQPDKDQIKTIPIMPQRRAAPATVAAVFCFALLAIFVFGRNSAHAFHQPPTTPTPTTPTTRTIIQTTRLPLPRRQSYSLLREHTLNQDSYDSTDDFVEEDGPKDQLLQEIVGDVTPVFGFGDEASISRVERLVGDLSGYVLPLESPSQWELLYTTAPDVLGFKGGPLSQLVSIQQDVSSLKTLDLRLEYKPSDAIQQLAGSFFEGVGDDRLVQTVQFGIVSRGPMNKFDIEIQGTRIEASRLESLLQQQLQPQLLQSPVPLPFVGFSIVFNDGNLRVDRSVQGDFLSVYQRIP
jgi:hypothetical protein